MRCLQETAPASVDVAGYMAAYAQWVIREQAFGPTDANGQRKGGGGGCVAFPLMRTN